MNVTRTTLGLLVLGLASIAPPSVAGDRAAEDVAPVRSASGLVSIHVEGHRAAGVAVRQDGLIVTARSVVAAASPDALLVELPDGRRLSARRVAEDRELALLRLEAPGPGGLGVPPLATGLPAPGASVRVGHARATLGAPLAEPAERRGLLSVWTPCPDAFAPGAPLLSADGELLGVTLGLEELPFLGPCLACASAAPVEQVQRLLERADVPLPALGLRLRKPWVSWPLFPIDEANESPARR
jgi:hypothetical protein